MKKALLTLTVLLAACGKPHDITLAISCVAADGNLKYELTQYTDRRDGGTCSKDNRTTYFNFNYEGDAERYEDFCVIPDGSLTVKYVAGQAKVTETGEVLTCTNK